MKKLISILYGVGVVMLLGCSQTNNTAIYKCPMKCQGDTAYAKQGTCAVCEMTLEPVNSTDTTHYIIK